MLFFSAAHWCVFPAEEWEEGYQVKHGGGPTFAFDDFASDVNMIIDSGKRSRNARRERKNELDGGKRSPSFGTMDNRNDTSEDGDLNHSEIFSPSYAKSLVDSKEDFVPDIIC